MSTMPRFTPLFDWVLQHTGDPTLTAVYGIIWRYCQLDDACCRATMARLAAECGVSVRTFQRALETLCRQRLVRRQVTPRGQPNVLYALPPPDTVTDVARRAAAKLSARDGHGDVQGVTKWPGKRLNKRLENTSYGKGGFGHVRAPEDWLERERRINNADDAGGRR